MSQQVQELIDKIKQDGYAAAQEQARQIEVRAREQAGRALAEAKDQAGRIVAEAQAQATRLQESAKAALVQASRDTLIVLRQNIQSLLKAIVDEKVTAALTPEVLATMIEQIIKGSLQDAASGAVEVTVNPDDLRKLEQSARARLQQQLKSGLTLRSSADLGGGFLISFDGGKSSFDFSDQSLADYLSSFLNANLAGILKDAVQK